MKSLLEALSVVREVPRLGWIQHGVPLELCETVAEHTLDALALSLAISLKLKDSGEDVDVEKVVTASLIHDLAESVTGDVPAPGWSLIGRERKHVVERRALERILSGTPLEGAASEPLSELEKAVVKVADMLATVARGVKYEGMGYRVGPIVNQIAADALEASRVNGKLRDVCSALLAELGVGREGP